VAKANELWPLGKDFRPSVMTSGNPVQLSSAWLKAFSGTCPSGQHRYTKSGRNLRNNKKVIIDIVEKSVFRTCLDLPVIQCCRSGFIEFGSGYGSGHFKRIRIRMRIQGFDDQKLKKIQLDFLFIF
jgi:hypothetical protein